MKFNNVVVHGINGESGNLVLRSLDAAEARQSLITHTTGRIHNPDTEKDYSLRLVKNYV